jgi:hypothetical protein
MNIEANDIRHHHRELVRAHSIPSIDSSFRRLGSTRYSISTSPAPAGAAVLRGHATGSAQPTTERRPRVVARARHCRPGALDRKVPLSDLARLSPTAHLPDRCGTHAASARHWSFRLAPNPFVFAACWSARLAPFAGRTRRRTARLPTTHLLQGSAVAPSSNFVHLMVGMPDYCLSIREANSLLAASRTQPFSSSFTALAGE